MIVRLHPAEQFPHVPCNRERVASYYARRALCDTTANAYPWRWTQREAYAREQAADHPNTSEGFAFKYGPAHGAD